MVSRYIINMYLASASAFTFSRVRDSVHEPTQPRSS